MHVCTSLEIAQEGKEGKGRRENKGESLTHKTKYSLTMG